MKDLFKYFILVITWIIFIIKIKLIILGKMKKRKIYQKSEKYLQFTLMKTNFETLGAINYISKILHKPPGFFGIAGTKV